MIERDNPLFIEAVTSQGRAEACITVATDMGIEVERVADEGNRYRTYKGVETTVPQGMVQIRINSGKRNMTDFWKKVDQLVSPIKR